MQSKLEGQISLEGVSFGYNILEKPLINDFSFNLESGESIQLDGNTYGTLHCEDNDTLNMHVTV